MKREGKAYSKDLVMNKMVWDRIEMALLKK